LFVTRPGLTAYVRTRDELLWRSGEVFNLVAQGKLHVRIAGRYPLAEARRAQEDLAARVKSGKLVLTM
jgi:NADPH2:quinone reductase